ncbi:hypothetical protein PG990_006858 [Apiospora arundinis]
MATTTDPGSPTATISRGAGPLTTVFHTPEFCDPQRWTDIGTPALSSSICMPPNFMQYYGNKAGMYSPAICPGGYTVGCAFPTALPSMDGTPVHGGPLLAGETAQICCPTGYTCYAGPQTYPDIPYSKCISTRSSRTYVNEAITKTERNMVYAIQVRWQESDLSNFETDPTVPGSTFNGPTATSKPNPGDDSPPHLPLNIVLAICIAVFLIAVLLGIVGWLFWRRHFWKQQTIHRQLASTPDLANSHFQDHNSHTRSTESLSSPAQDTSIFTRQSARPYSRPGTSSYMVSPLTPAVSEMGVAASAAGTLTPIHEADSRPWMELETREELQELPTASTSFAVELEGSTPGDIITPPPGSQLQQSQLSRPPPRGEPQQPQAYTTSKADEAAAENKASSNNGSTRRRKSLGVNRLTQQNPPPPYSDAA